ncbi:hypothetical protein RUM43_010106 [Polyplax serrata]|uniref:Potassium channel domain-containing protein n=1 Tax=Polyplax serrata TaxID=468196 RepID=A0AAN8S9X4_POLSC
MDRRPSRRSYGRSNSRYEKSCKEKCKDFLRQFIAFMFTNVGIIGLVVAYTIAGAFMFIAIEGNEGESLIEDVVRLRNNTVDELWDVTCCRINVFSEASWRNHVSTQLIEYQRTFVDAVRNGYDPKHTDSWSFSGAFLYSLTVITTIGYGNVAPRTEWGKLATIVYAIAGMPLFLLYLSNIGDILAKSFKWSYTKVCLCKGCPGTESFRRKRVRQDIQMTILESDGRDFPYSKNWQAPHLEEDESPVPRSRNQTEDEDGDDESTTSDGDGRSFNTEEDTSSMMDEEYDPQTVTVPITLCLAIMVGYVCGGALLFARWENWGFLDGSYFCFISLSTIGFGDIVPGDSIIQSEVIQISFILTAVYLMLGMALIAMCFNLMQEEVIHKTRSCIKCCKNVFYCCFGKTKN